MRNINPFRKSISKTARITKERTSTTFQRQFAVKDIEESKISASLNDGVLKIELPKKDMTLPKQGHRIEIG